MADLSYNWDEKLILRAGYANAKPDASISRFDTNMSNTLTQNATSAPPFDGSQLSGAVIPYGLALAASAPAQLISFGLKADLYDTFVISEFVRRLVNGPAFPTASGFYAALGHRFGKFVPLVTWAWQGDVTGTAFGDYHGQSSWTATAGYHVTDFAVIKAEGSVYKPNFSDGLDHPNYSVLRATIDFVF
jgi:hypothetical protein